MSRVAEIRSREILDSRGNPTIETEVVLESGAIGVATVPSGASTGASEALELRDNDPKRYRGKGVLKAVDNVRNVIGRQVIEMEAGSQEGIDQKMIDLDGSANKSNLGANAILSVSLAVCRAAANEKNIPLFQHIAQTFGFSDLKFQTIPMFNIINGGKHSDSGLSVQEFKIIPSGIKKYSEQLRAGSEVFYSLKNLLETEGFRVVVGDEGGFAPKLRSHEQALEFIVKAISEAGYEPGKDISVGLDAAANSFFDSDSEKYVLEPEGATMNKEDLIGMYEEWIGKYHIISVEDGLSEEDWEGWAAMEERIGGRVMTIGDDLLVTNPSRLQRAIEHKACNSVLVKVNQIGTVTEAINCIKLAQKNNIKTIVSHRSGETTDDFIADLAIGTNADFIKTGSVTRGERVCKYNRLLKIQ